MMAREANSTGERALEANKRQVAEQQLTGRRKGQYMGQPRESEKRPGT